MDTHVSPERCLIAEWLSIDTGGDQGDVGSACGRLCEPPPGLCAGNPSNCNADDSYRSTMNLQGAIVHGGVDAGIAALMSIESSDIAHPDDRVGGAVDRDLRHPRPSVAP